MALNYGEGGTYSVRMDGPFGSVGSSVKVTTIAAPAADWKGAISPYSQVVNAAVSKNSQVDLKLSPEQLEALRDREMAFTACNEGGVVTIYALGDKPETDMEFQAALIEVLAEGSGSFSIYGNTVTTTAARSDYAESDPASASYILNRPTDAIEAALAALPRSGGTMTGDIVMGGNKVTGLADPSGDTDAAHKKYVHDYVADYVADNVPNMINEALGVIENGTY